MEQSSKPNVSGKVRRSAKKASASEVCLLRFHTRRADILRFSLPAGICPESEEKFLRVFCVKKDVPAFVARDVLRLAGRCKNAGSTAHVKRHVSLLHRRQRVLEDEHGQPHRMWLLTAEGVSELLTGIGSPAALRLLNWLMHQSPDTLRCFFKSDAPFVFKQSVRNLKVRNAALEAENNDLACQLIAWETAANDLNLLHQTLTACLPTIKALKA